MKENWPDWNTYKQYSCTCVYCGFSGDGIDKFHNWRQLAIDHLIPVSKGGTNDPHNKVVACHRCNTMKGCFDPSEGTRPGKISDERKKHFIEAVKKHLDLDNSEEHKDFKLMMSEL